MISFSNNVASKAALDQLKANSQLVIDRIYFIENVGVFIATANNEYKKYDYDFSTEFAGKADKAPGTAGTIFTNNGTEGNLVSSLYSVGTTSATGFGTANKLATEQGAKAYVDQVSAAIDPKYIPKVNPATADDLPILTATGTLTDSNVKIGAADKTDFGVSGEVARESAVKEYVDAAIQGVTSDAITGISYSNESAKLSAVIGGVNTEITPGISGLVRGFSYASNVVTLKTTKADGTTEDHVINIPAEQLLSGVAYVQIPDDFATTGVVATFKTGDAPTLTSADITPNGAKFGIVFRFATQTIDTQTFTGTYTFVPVEDLVKDYNTTQFTISEGKLTLLSTFTDSIISGKIDKVLNETGEVPQFKADGNIESTGYSVGTTSANTFGAANKLATEVGTSAWVDTNYISKFAATSGTVALADGSNELVSSSYKIGAANATGDNPTFGGANLLATESAIADLLSFK